jgi:hypothetical protein
MREARSPENGTGRRYGRKLLEWVTGATLYMVQECIDKEIGGSDMCQQSAEGM